MARYFGQGLTQEGRAHTPSTAALGGMQPLIRNRAEAAMRAQDKVVSQSRRTLMRTGVDGADAWLIPNTGQPAAGLTQECPEPNVVRAIGRALFDVTPGCTL